MWYRKLYRQAKIELTGIGKRLVAEYGRMFYGYLYRHAPTAPEDEIICWVDPYEGKWLVSKGDWADTPDKVIKDAINYIAENFHKSMKTEYKKPEIEIEWEIGSPGDGDWIQLTHDF